MATVVKTFTFDSGAEGLVDQAVSGVTFSFLSSDGNPSGCVRFVQTTKNTIQTEVAFNNVPASFDTWEDWGVPAGATVTNLQLTAWDEKLAANTKLDAHAIDIKVADTNGISVVEEDVLISIGLGTAVDSAWQAGAAGSLATVVSNRQASNTPVSLYFEYVVDTGTGGGSANVDQRFDNIELTITYTAAGLTLAGASAGQSTAAGAIAVARTLAGIANAISTSSGGIAVARTLAGLSAGVSTANGTLTTAGQVLFAGVSAAVSAASGAVAVARNLAGQSVATSTATGNVAVARTLAGLSAAQSAASGTLTIFGQVLLAGASAAVSTAQGAIAVARRLAGISAGTSLASGGIAVQRRLAGVSNAVSSAAGSLSVPVQVLLAGASNAVSSASGSLHVSIQVLLAGVSAAISAAFGALKITGPVVLFTVKSNVEAASYAVMTEQTLESASEVKSTSIADSGNIPASRADAWAE